MANDASDIREKLSHMTGGATTNLVFELKFSEKREWVNYLHNFRRNGGQQALLEKLQDYVVERCRLLARVTDAVGMYRVSKEYDGAHLRSHYNYWIRLTLEGVPVMSNLNRQRLAAGMQESLNGILEGCPVASATLIC